MLTKVADVRAMVADEVATLGWVYTEQVADVTAMVADGMAT